MATTRARHTRKGTFGNHEQNEKIFKKPSESNFTGIKPRSKLDILGSAGNANEISIVSGSDEEEVMHVDPTEQSGGQLDQDFDFIDEVLASHMQDM